MGRKGKKDGARSRCQREELVSVERVGIKERSWYQKVNRREKLVSKGRQEGGASIKR